MIAIADKSITRGPVPVTTQPVTALLFSLASMWIGVKWLLHCHRQADDTTPQFHHVSNSIGGCGTFQFLKRAVFRFADEKQAGTENEVRKC